MDPEQGATPTPTTFHESNNEKENKDVTLREFIDVDNAILREDLPFLKTYVNGTDTSDVRRVNLSGDPLLNVMINYGSKNELLLDLIKMMTAKKLEATNMVGDTALHVAAANNNLRVVTALISKNSNLIEKRNKKLETPLLKAALSGSADTFRKLVKCGSDIFCRAKNGENVLHYVILGNNPELALEIAQHCKALTYGRNSQALTPLQLLVTIPEAFRSKLELGPAESFIYTFIQLNSDDGESKETERNRDEEELGESISNNHWVESNAERDKLLKNSVAVSSKKFMQKYQVTWPLFYVANLIVFKRVEGLEILKKNHMQTMKLIEYLAKDEMFWDFINLLSPKQKQTETVSGDDAMKDFMYDDDDDDDNDNDDDDVDDVREKKFLIKELLKVTESVIEKRIREPTRWSESLHKVIKEHLELTDSLAKESIRAAKEPNRGTTRWTESPLIVGAKMGIDDFVEQILKVYPQSAKIKGMDGRNVLQVAVKHRHEKIVKAISLMINGPNPVLPSWLLSDIDSKNNTILHYAAEATNKDEGFALQMQREIKWFEMVKNMLPKDLVYSRNIDEKTAQELFYENHTEMVKSGKKKLMDIGKTCSAGLLAAVVYTTSFNIPGGKDSDSITGPSNSRNMNNTQGNPFNESVGFKVFTHAYVIGLSFAICSLLLFLSLLTTNYTMEAFRKSLPIKYILAAVTFVLASLSLLVAFTCNIYISIYGGEPSKTQNLLPFIIELTGIPILYAVAGFFGGFGIPFWDVIQSTLGR